MSKPKDVTSLKDLSVLLDSQFKGPFGIRFGWDALLGLIPVIGDVLTSCLSFYIIIRAAFLGCGPSTLLRMLLNVLLENLFDLIPVLGNFFDFFWKANLKNVELLKRHLEQPEKVRLQSRLILIAICLIFVGVVSFFAWVSWLIWAKLMALF